MRGYYHYTPVEIHFYRHKIPAGAFYGFYGTQVFCSSGKKNQPLNGTILHIWNENGQRKKILVNDSFTKEMNRQFERIIHARSVQREKKQKSEMVNYPDCVSMSYVPTPKTYR